MKQQHNNKRTHGKEVINWSVCEKSKPVSMHSLKECFTIPDKGLHTSHF